MTFGNWSINDTTIEWTGPGQQFVIDLKNLLDTVQVEDSADDLYKWIVLATTEDWIADDDLYDLNFAFVHAAGASRQELDYKVFDKTLEYQFEMLDEVDDE